MKTLIGVSLAWFLIAAFALSPDKRRSETVSLTREQIMIVYANGWAQGRLAQLSKQYFKSDPTMIWKRDSIFFITAIDTINYENERGNNHSGRPEILSKTTR
jgi:hypothetical protein